VFGGEFIGSISRFRDIPPSENTPPLPEADKALVMHIALPILNGHVLMGTDAPESMGFKVHFGNNVYISLHPDQGRKTKNYLNLSSKAAK
jgi:PhnB protein